MPVIARSKIKIKLVVFASALILSACGGGGGSPPPPPPVTLHSIVVTPSSTSLALNFDQQFTATGIYSDNSTQNITTLASWSSSSAVVATVNISTGLVTPAGGASPGQATVITATSSGLTGSAALTLAPAAILNAIAVTPQNRSVAVNSTLQLTATGTYSNSRTKNLTSSVTWSSGATGVATVDVGTGLVTPAGLVGQSEVITATSGGLTPATSIVRLAGATFSLASVTDPLALQQWGLRNTAQNGYADTAGVANNAGGTLGTDINVNPVFTNYGYTGWGVIVAVVDSGLEIAHEDLSANVVTGGSWNFINSSTDPTNTTATTGDHGTEVSGLIAMANNNIGGIGVAPNAQLKGFNYISGSQLQADALVSLGGSSTSPNSSDVAVFNQSYGLSNTADLLMNTVIEAQYASGTSILRGGKGALYVKSAGNGFKSYAFTGNTEVDGCIYADGAHSIGVSCQNANFDPSNTLPYNIVMAALNAKGKKSSYSSAGSAIWASAPGGEFGFNYSVVSAVSGITPPAPGNVIYDPAMVTTDQSGCAKGSSVSTAPTSTSGPYSVFNRGGTNLASINLSCNYTNSMNGTSSAAPMMTGVIALILEANPELTWREVKDILAKTAVKIDASIAPITVALGNGNYVAEQGWITNAAGFNFHNWYGFGAVNASAAVAMATTYASSTLGTFANTGWIDGGTLNSVIADNSTAGVIVQFPGTSVGASNKVEAVQVKVTTANMLNGYIGDLGIELTSPSGTRSILKNIKDGFNGSDHLTGMVLASNAFYGETSLGTWTVKVVDGWIGGTQTLTNVQIRIYGH